jgi:hypothetical protein
MIRSDQKFLSEREAAFLYSKKLPNFLLEKVEKERLRHSGQEFLFLRGLPGLTPHEVRQFVASILGLSPSITKKLDDGFLVGVSSKEQAEMLLARDRLPLTSGCTLSVERSDFLLTVDEIAVLVRQTFEPRESAEEIKKNFVAPKYHQKARVNEVDMDVDGGGPAPPPWKLLPWPGPRRARSRQARLRPAAALVRGVCLLPCHPSPLPLLPRQGRRHPVHPPLSSHSRIGVGRIHGSFRMMAKVAKASLAAKAKLAILAKVALVESGKGDWNGGFGSWNEGMGKGQGKRSQC